MSDYSSTYPTQSPTFAFDAKAGKLDSRISYSRSSTGTYMSNERHLSSENLITQSQFSGWSKLTSPTVTAAYANGPDGSSNTATRLQSASGANRFFYSTATSWTSGQQYTVSCWVKSNTGVAQTFAFFLPTTAYASADLTTHATDWTRITATFTAATSSIYCGFKLLSANTTDLSIWGFQVNSGANALDYQATSGSIHREFASTLKTVSADEPRFEFSATDGQSVGLLIEQQSSNLARYGSDVANWVTMSDVGITTNAAVAPNGELEADLVVATSAPSDHYVYDNAPTITSGTAYTASVYVKDAAQRYVQFVGASNVFGNGQYATFDLQTGSVDANGVTASAQNVGNGWHRIQMTMTATLSGSGSAFIALANSGTASRSPSFTGNDYDGLLLWGFQLETGSAASSLANSGTSSSGVTRSADSCSVATSSFYTGGPVSIVAETEAGDGTGNNPRLFNLNDGSDTTRLMLYKNSTAADNTVAWYAYYGTAGMGTLAGSNNSSKVAVSVDTNDFAATSDTGTLLTNATGTQYNFSHLYIGSNYNGTAHQLNGHIKRLSLFNVALSDTELAALVD